MPSKHKTTASFHLGPYQTLFEAALQDLDNGQIIRRLWAHDHTIWKPEPEEITNRLGWLELPKEMLSEIEKLTHFSDQVQSLGYKKCVLLGMGGSSLAPEVFASTFGSKAGHLDLIVLDSTDPRAISTVSAGLDLEKTLFIVSTKSGTTVETLSLFKYFYNLLAERVQAKKVGEHFLAITDPGTRLDGIAQKYDFLRIFRNNPNLGGRFSALSLVGLVPASLMGIDIKLLLDRAFQAATNCGVDHRATDGDNRGANLGAALGVLALQGRDKLNLFLSPEIASFGNWIEQLIAESTGKEKKGILPMIGDQPSELLKYGTDRLFVCLQLENDRMMDDQIERLYINKQPTIILPLVDRYDLGAQFFLWEFATAITGHLLEVNPFDQPNVESAKSIARQYVKEYQHGGDLPSLKPDLVTPDFDLFFPTQIKLEDLSHENPVGSVLDHLFKMAQPEAYVALQAYLPPAIGITTGLEKFRILIRDHTGLATTLGFGPRFLHSTGQLHKGDSGKGLFIQLTSQSERDIAIPDEAGVAGSTISFGILEAAQALGDFQALIDAGRLVLRIHLKREIEECLTQLIQALGSAD